MKMFHIFVFHILKEKNVSTEFLDRSQLQTQKSNYQVSRLKCNILRKFILGVIFSKILKFY